MEVYIGAYLEVKCDKIEKVKKERWCKNWCNQFYTEFCPTCGEPVETIEVVTDEYPDVYDLISDERVAELWDMSARVKRQELDTLIVVDNHSATSASSSWFRIYNYSDNPPIKLLPSDEEQFELKHNLLTSKAEVIKEIKNHPAVRDVQARTGIIAYQD